jgi:hypothetical protein
MQVVMVPKRPQRLAVLALQVRPHAPQFENDGSVVEPAPSRATHVEPQHWKSAPHAGEQLPVTGASAPTTRASADPASGSPLVVMHAPPTQI